MGLKVLLVSEHFFPLSKGGTEQYIYFLAKGLMDMGHEVVVISADPELKQGYYEEIPVRYVTSFSGNDLQVIRGFRPADNLDEFLDVIREERPDLVHFHTLTSSVNHFHIEGVKSLGCKTVYTSHIPGDLCLRGDLLERGRKICNGKIGFFKCATCLINSKHNNAFSIKSLVRSIVYLLPTKYSPVRSRMDKLSKVVNSADKIVTVCSWQQEYWKRNFKTKPSIFICRQGVESVVREVSGKMSGQRPLRLGFVGRISKMKGIHLLFDALKEFSVSEVEVFIAGIPVTNEPEYYSVLRNTILKVRVTWMENLGSQEIAAFYRDIDYLIVPSLCLETGPFVVYEALANQTPVIASNLGGMTELIKDGENGFLFEPNAKELSALLKKLILQKPYLSLSGNTRSSKQIAVEMEEEYALLLS